MLEQAQIKINLAALSEIVIFKEGDARKLQYPDETFDLVYNGYMFDLIALDGFLPILNEMKRVLKPGGKLVLVNMSKPSDKKTFFETVYAKGWAVMPCRPVLMSPYLKQAGFSDIERIYHPTRGSIISLLWGQEIVLAKKL
jgi:ubiquinone/menaquinone biosynthesis C-methylase UbiE